MNWLQRFMYGRHGPDQMTLGLIVLFLVLNFVNIFLRGIPYLILAVLTTAIFIYALFRMFSRNNEKRWAENQKFLSDMQPVSRFFSQLRTRWADRKVYRYYRCPKCKATLRVPRGRGKISITCPVCHTEFIKKA
ncbi:MAG: hypothetical protein LKE53_02875 [Oscillospiraceae bacterium]|jgi:predicted membrane protein|nr:hypothetical protein [Oscillospiraceae bacterium]MDD3262196.1 hypothetical protein [Oscillospiraceae bacterium]